MGNTKNPRVVLQFNDTDFRHTRVLEILRRKPRSKTELIVNIQFAQLLHHNKGLHDILIVCVIVRFISRMKKAKILCKLFAKLHSFRDLLLLVR